MINTTNYSAPHFGKKMVPNTYFVWYRNRGTIQNVRHSLAYTAFSMNLEYYSDKTEGSLIIKSLEQGRIPNQRTLFGEEHILKC